MGCTLKNLQNGGKKTKQRQAEPKIIQLGLVKIDFHNMT